MQAGTALTGRLVVENNTMHPVAIPRTDQGCRIPWGVTLVNGSHAANLSFPQRAVCTRGVEQLLPGANYLQFTIVARESSCTTVPVSDPRAVHCLANGQPPPLPPGRYDAVLVPSSGLFPTPDPVPVLVVAPG